MGLYKMSKKHLRNKYSNEADEFGLGGGGFGGGFDDSGFGGGGFGGGSSSMPGSTPNDDGLKAQDSIVVRGWKRLRHLLGIAFGSDMPEPKRQTPINLYAYGRDEMKYLAGFLGQNTSMPGASYDRAQYSSITEYLANAVNNAATWEREARTSNILTPEIPIAKEIMVSSIMSPIDLQTDKVNIIVDGSTLPPVVEEKVSEKITEFMNKEVNLSRHMSRGIGESLYGPGAVPILVLPQSNIYVMRKLADIDLEKNGIKPRDLVKGIAPTSRPNTAKTITSGEELGVFGEQGLKPSFESLSFGESDETVKLAMERMEDAICREALFSFEEMKMIPVGEGKGQTKDLKVPKQSEVVVNTDKLKASVKELMKNGLNYIRFSTDPNVVGFHGGSLQNKIDKMQADIDKHLVQLGGMTSPILQLSADTVEDNEDSNNVKDEAPAILELPYQSVIPVIIPGAPSQHIGYFIAVNEWGDPVTPENRDINNFYSNSRIMEANLQANLGVPSDLVANNEMTGTQRFKATSVLFGIMLRNFMTKKLEEYGLGGTKLEQHEMITACLFRNLLDQKKIGLVFVPEPMLTYFSYDHHDDGTGKPLIEDIRMIIGLRTTLITAGVMAAAENSIDQKIITINVDDKNANFAQLMEQVRNGFIEKRVMRFDTNPFNITRQIAARSITLVPQGVRGLPDNLSVQTDHRSAGSIQPDNPLLDQLNQWMIQALKVPASAMTQTSEADFARSVVTTNLCFNNRVKIYQFETNRLGTKLVRAYMKYSTALQEQILDVLKQSYHDSEEKDKNDPKPSQEDQAYSEDQKKEMREKADKLRKKDTEPHESDVKIKMSDKKPAEQLYDIMMHTFVKLPEPRIVVDKAQYEEITNFADAIDRVTNSIYSDELLTESDQHYSSTFRAVKAVVKETLLRSYIKKTGVASAFDLPDLRDVDTDVLDNLFFRMMNIEKGLRTIRDKVDTKINNNGEEMNNGGMGMGGGLGGAGGYDTTGGGGGLGDLGLGTGTEPTDVNGEQGSDTSQTTTGSETGENGEPAGI